MSRTPRTPRADRAPRAAGTARNGRRSRLLGRDVITLGTTGLRARPLRAVLSALGIAIGIAAMISVVGVSTSSQAQLNDQLDKLGTNMLVVSPGKTMFGEDAKLPEDSVDMIGRLPDVEQVSATGKLNNVFAYRSPLIKESDTNALVVQAAKLDLLKVTAAELASGTWLNEATAQYPAVVLGSVAAKRLGIVEPGALVWIGGQEFQVVGILDPVALAPDLDSSALIGEQVAADLFGYDRSPTTVYERSVPEKVNEVRSLLPSMANPQDPMGVDVSRPSDALQAKLAADQAFTGLLVGLGSIGLLVGGIGVANTMVISVLERRREIGLRRALGATRGHIRTQFIAEALLLSGLGGVAGAVIGLIATAVFAAMNGWPAVVPIPVLGAGVLVTVGIGAIAGLYPAIRAARTPPTAALAS